MQTVSARLDLTAEAATERRVVDPPDLVSAFLELLANHPDALIACAGDDGIVTTMPESVPLVRHRVAMSRSVIDMVTAGDKVAVIATWERSRLVGGASTIVHLLTDPEQPVVLTIVDAVRVYGVHLALLVPVDGLSSMVGERSMAPIAPRTARVLKTELAMITDVDAATTKILGWRPEEIVGRRSLDFIHPDDQERSISNWMEMLTAPGHEQRVRLRHLTADGSWLWMEFTNRNLLNDPDHPRVVAEMLDISEELAAQEALRASEQRLRRLAESLPLGVVQIEADQRISYANARLAAITGSTSTETIDEQFCHVTPTDRPRFDAALREVLEGGVDQDLTIDFAGSDSNDGGLPTTARHCTMSMRSLTNDTGRVTGAIVCVSDVSDQVRMTVELERRATFDALTGCLNRASIMFDLEASLGRLATDIGGGVAIVFVDLNDFKAVNDDLGHAVGDALLCGVAGLLRNAVRDGDLVGRVGGDEFLVVCPNVADIDEALALAARIDVVLEDGVRIGTTTLVVTASLGVAHTTDPHTSSDRLVADADTKMYIDKRDRKGRAVTGAAATRSRTRRVESSAALRDAIRARQFEVHYQPIVEMPSEGLVGLEALIRWRRGASVIPAAEFIGLAERSGLITEIGEFVLGDSVRTAAAAPSASNHVRWFVNMSPLELACPTKVAELRDALDRNGVDAGRIVIEITEHSDLAGSPEALRAVNELAELGIGVALDDFGTGYGSLSLLRSVPVSYLKFDRSFTVDLGHDPIAGHVLETCMSLAARMNMALIAEGVETIEQRDHLMEMGVLLGQGYLFGKPQPISSIFDAIVG